MYDDFQIISHNIKSLREKKGLTQEQLAEAADLSVSHFFVALTADEEKENYFRRFQEIMKGCSEAEQKFLIDSLQTLKKNLTVLLESNA